MTVSYSHYTLWFKTQKECRASKLQHLLMYSAKCACNCSPSTQCTDTSHRSYRNCSCATRAMGKFTKYHTIAGIIPNHWPSKYSLTMKWINTNIKQTNTMQLGSDLYYCTSWLIYMFRAPLAPIIRSTTTVYAASGTSYTSDNRLPTWPSLNSCHLYGCWYMSVLVVFVDIFYCTIWLRLSYTVFFWCFCTGIFLLPVWPRWILGSWYRASRINIKQTNTMQLGSDLYYCISLLLYMFRAPLAPIIRSTTTVYAASGTSYTSDNRLPTWPSLKYHFWRNACFVSRWLSYIVYISSFTGITTHLGL